MPTKLKAEAASGKGGLFITNFRSGIPARRQMTVDRKLCVQGVSGEYNKSKDWLKVNLIIARFLNKGQVNLSG